MPKAITDQAVTLTREEINNLGHADLLNGVVSYIAGRAVELSNREHATDKHLRLISSTITTFRNVGESPLSAHARLANRVNGNHLIWNVSIWEGDKTNANESSAVAEVIATYELSDAPQEQEGVAEEAASNVYQFPEAQEESMPVGLQKVDGQSDIQSERRRQIFMGACKVIAKQGFGNSSIREIAQAAGMSVPLMYKHIKDKEDILYLITSECMRDLLDYFEKDDPKQNKPRENIKYAVEKYVDYINENRRYINLVYSETRALNAENRAKIFQMERKFLQYWEGIIRDGIVRGEFKNVNAELYSNYVYFLCTVWSLRHWSIGHFNDRMIKATLVEFVLEGIT